MYLDFDGRFRVVIVYEDLGADIIIYTPFMAELEHAVKLLESGANVISSNLFSNVGGIRGDVEAKLQAACERGNSSLFVSGVNPGWINSTIASLAAVCSRVEAVSIAESADCSTYESAETWQAMGMGATEASDKVKALAKDWLVSFRDAVERVAEALSITLDDMEFSVEFATAAEKVDLGWYCMEKDTIAAVRGGWDGMLNGRAVVTIRVTWYLTRHLNEGWELDDDHYHLVIEGNPGIDTRIRFIAPKHWSNNDWDTLTAMPVVNAAFNVHAAPAGILGLKDAGLVCPPAGLWEAKA